MAKLFICGDICNHTPGLNFIGDSLAKEIQKADYAICNFEGPELKEGQTARCPHQEMGTANYLRSQGFGLMLLANNHITELGANGLHYSIDTIKSTGCDYIGAGLSWDEAYKPLIKNICGKRIGFINICEAQVGHFLAPDQSYGYAWMGYDGLSKDIKQLSNVTDFVIVFVHAGLEHYSIPLPEIRQLYQKLCDWGASAVIGGHPHVAQGYEYYHNKLIVYSLGNFYFPYTDGKRLEENRSYSIILDIKDDCSINVTPIHHCLNDNQVDLITELSKQIDVESLCAFLGDGYNKRAGEMCESAYRTLCSHLLAEATCGYYEGIYYVQWCKRMIHYLLKWKTEVIKTQKRRDILLLRLFENETYYWTIKRALKYNNRNNEI